MLAPVSSLCLVSGGQAANLWTAPRLDHLLLVTKLALAVNSQKKMGKIQLLYNVVRLLSRRTKLKIWSFYVFREEFRVLPELSNPDLLQ